MCRPSGLHATHVNEAQRQPGIVVGTGRPSRWDRTSFGALLIWSRAGVGVPSSNEANMAGTTTDSAHARLLIILRSALPLSSLPASCQPSWCLLQHAHNSIFRDAPPNPCGEREAGLGRGT